MKKLSLMNKFNKSMKESINEDYQNRVKDINGRFKFYYDNSYAVSIYSYFIKRGFSSKELSFKNDSKNLPICSVSSSARLCLLYFLKKYSDDSFLLEQSYPIVKTNGSILTNAHPDAIVGNIYYECKAQEVVDGESERINKSYLASAKYFKEIIDENKVSVVSDFLDFDMSALGVKIEKKYYDMKLDIKQLICHLLAIANEVDKSNECWTLKYLIFRPSRRFDSDVKEIYENLEYEFNNILNSQNKIIEFCNRHKINIEKEYVYIDDMDEGIIEILKSYIH